MRWIASNISDFWMCPVPEPSELSSSDMKTFKELLLPISLFWWNSRPSFFMKKSIPECSVQVVWVTIRLVWADVRADQQVLEQSRCVFLLRSLHVFAWRIPLPRVFCVRTESPASLCPQYEELQLWPVVLQSGVRLLRVQRSKRPWRESRSLWTLKPGQHLLYELRRTGETTFDHISPLSWL